MNTTLPNDTVPVDVPEASAEDKEAVEKERELLAKFVQGLTMDDIRGGNWFAKLLTFSLATYQEKVNAEYFRDKYLRVPIDAVVDQRIKMASRYAAIEGGLSASAYTVAIAATIGSLGGASPIAVPAAISSLMVDVVYLSQLQLRLAYDISVLYRLRIDTSDPEDLWKLIRVAFVIKGGETVRQGVMKGVPVVVRPLVKRFVAGPTLAAVKSLPVIGKFLLQRNIIKIGIPLLGIPLAVLLNEWSTVVAGRHAKKVFRNEARIRETAERLVTCSKHPRLMLWVAWLVVVAEMKRSDDEALLMRDLIRLAHELHSVDAEDLAQVVEIDPDDVWTRVRAEHGDFDDIIATAEVVAGIDGPVNKLEADLLDEIRRRCSTSTSATTEATERSASAVDTDKE